MTIFKRQKRNKYAKIPKKHKILFLRKVIEQKQPLKSTADLFKINYSTAKTLIRQFRADSLELDITQCSNDESNNFSQNKQKLKRCTFKQVCFSQKHMDASLISFSIDQGQNDKEKYDKKVGYIVIWPKKQAKHQGIQIVSKIQFA